jgi:hypothetical protein
MFVKESPDYLDADINGTVYELTIDNLYNPITFFHTNDVGFWPEPNNSKELPFQCGEVTIFAPTILPDGKMLAHASIIDILRDEDELTYRQAKQKWNIDIYFHNPKKQKEFEQLLQKYPNIVTVPLARYDTTRYGRTWYINSIYTAVFAMWHFNKQIVTKLTVPFLQKLYPKVLENNIFFQRAESEPVLPISEILHAKELKPYEKELAGWLAQLHIASGDEERKSEIKSEIERIVKQHGLDPKKYGIGVEIPKSSQNLQKKQLGNSKMSMAELKSKERTSESTIGTFRDYCLKEKSVHDPVRPGILKRQVKGKMTCSKARSLKSKQKNKGNNTAKAAQRYLNYHC